MATDMDIEMDIDMDLDLGGAGLVEPEAIVRETQL